MAALQLRMPLAPREVFDRHLDLFLTHCRAKNYSPRTVDEFYRFEFLAFRRYLDEHQLDLAPEDITAEVVRDFLAYRQQGRIGGG